MAPIATTIPTKISVVVFGENLIFFPLQSWGVKICMHVIFSQRAQK